MPRGAEALPKRIQEGTPKAGHVGLLSPGLDSGAADPHAEMGRETRPHELSLPRLPGRSPALSPPILQIHQSPEGAILEPTQEVSEEGAR